MINAIMFDNTKSTNLYTKLPYHQILNDGVSLRKSSKKFLFQLGCPQRYKENIRHENGFTKIDLVWDGHSDTSQDC